VAYRECQRQERKSLHHIVLCLFRIFRDVSESPPRTCPPAVKLIVWAPSQLKTGTLTPAQLREKARTEWLEFRNVGKASDKTQGREQARERDATDDSGKEKGKSRTRDDDDFSL
jgi:hypothetical protein